MAYEFSKAFKTANATDKYGKKARSANVSALFNQLYGSNASNYAGAIGYQRKANAAAVGGLQAGQGAVSAGGYDAKTAIMGNNAVGAAALGLDPSQMGGAQQYGAVDAAIAGLLADLQSKQLGVANAGRGAVAGLYGNRQTQLGNIAGLQSTFLIKKKKTHKLAALSGVPYIGAFAQAASSEGF